MLATEGSIITKILVPLFLGLHSSMSQLNPILLVKVFVAVLVYIYMNTRPS